MNQDSPLSLLLKEPGRSALMSDVDGTLCRIVDRPDNARVPVKAKESLETLCRELALVACVTGRPAKVARKMVGADSVTYFGNHGLELLEPGKEEPEMVLEGEQVTRAARFIADNDSPHWISAKIRVEDKGPIQALHWRGAGQRTEQMVREIAEDARAADLVTHWGRKVLELRPPDMEGKAGAVEALLTDTGLTTVVFAGDDQTDLDAVKRLRKMKSDGQIDQLLIVAVDSDEGPPELMEIADLVVGGSDDWIDMISNLAD
jgi:trehalose 6-phosphate phosphatase